MERNLLCSASLAICIVIGSTAHATVGCSVISDTKGAISAKLYQDPDDGAGVLREVPLGDIVQYPAQELAPLQAANWIWVRHDATQQAIWNSGIYGWMKPENISDDCG